MSPITMSMECAFEQIPPQITKIRYEAAFFSYRKRKDERLDLIIGNIKSIYHLHIYTKENQLYGIITREPTDTMPKAHGKEFQMLDFLHCFQPVGELIACIETVSKYDRRFSGKNVQMMSFHRFRFDQTKGGNSYIDHDLEYREYNFENIDLDLPQIGVMKDWFGREIALVLVGQGEVHILRLKHIKKYAKRLEQELRKFGFHCLYPV